jgi:hypothetical protein
MGEEGEEMSAVIGGQVFEVHREKEKKEEGRWTYVKRSEVDWAQVALDGGLGDLVVLEDSEDEDETESGVNAVDKAGKVGRREDSMMPCTE